MMDSYIFDNETWNSNLIDLELLFVGDNSQVNPSSYMYVNLKMPTMEG